MTAAGWVLILFAHVGARVPGNSNALTVAYFTTQENCHAAGQASIRLAGGSTKEIKYTCQKQ